MIRSDRFTELIYGERFDVKVTIFKFSALQTAHFSAKMLTIHHAFSPEEETREVEWNESKEEQDSKHSHSSSEEEVEQKRAVSAIFEGGKGHPRCFNRECCEINHQGSGQ